MNSSQREKIIKILFAYGFESQKAQAVEELLELAALLQKSRRKDKMNRELCIEICKEIADVKIMVEQLDIIFDHMLISETIDYKLDREIARIELLK
jgi:hypothetical protein